MATLCNQGCGSHVVFIDGKPYNQDRKTPHSETCISLKFGKWWGGRYNTIPMKYIDSKIQDISERNKHASETRNIDDILGALNFTIFEIGRTKEIMNEQAERNAKWSQEFDEYKVNLVKQQKEREQKEQEPHFVRGDELQ